MKRVISHINPSSEQSKDWGIQTNEDHSKGVAKLAESFAAQFGFKEWGEIIGLLHDKGKEQEDFQKYIRGVTGYEHISFHKVQHAYVGALIAKKLYEQLFVFFSYPIMGHHAGLADYEKFNSTMKEAVPKEVIVEELNISPTLPSNLNFQGQDIHHLIRMLFSCLVDADFLDTERFMNVDNFNLRQHNLSLPQLLPKLDAYLSLLKMNAPDTAVNNIRNEIQKVCLMASEETPGFFSLTVPTGGGKTLSSLVWAIHHAIKNGKKRIIIAIPYTSIIVQTAQILRNIFGEENVLEHHSNTNGEGIKDKKKLLKWKLATENWDYPIVVTTNVQLFESMFSNKPSNCRKLHNIVNSVLILDEVQTLPLNYLQPIVDSLKTYQRIFGTSVIFTTASQPALKGEIRWNSDPRKGLHGITDIKEIIPSHFNLHEKLRRIELHFEEKPVSYEEMASRISEYERVLCIVNTRKDAQKLYSLLPKEEGTYHLSRMMCSAHVNSTINAIKNALKDPLSPRVRVVTTQLIEAGVDIDFPIVFRQEAGLDSILQAAGRCNREGHQEMGNTYVFNFEGSILRGSLKECANAQKAVPKTIDMFAPETMIKYFIQLYSRHESFDSEGIYDFLCKPFNFYFEEAASRFKLIEDNAYSVIVNYEDSFELIEQLKKEGPSYSLIKKLNQYTVNIHKNDFNRLKESNLLDEVMEGYYYLPDREQYDKDTGIQFDSHWLEEILIK